MKLILLTLLLTQITYAQSSWQTDVSELMDGSSKEAAIRERLLKDPKLNEQLTKAIETGNQDERIAIEAVRRLGKLELAPVLQKKLSKLGLEEDTGRVYFITLVELSVAEKNSSILNGLLQTYPLDSQKVPASAKVALLNAQVVKTAYASEKVLLSLLGDESYEVRIAAMENVVQELKEKPKAHHPFLRKSLVLSPYTLRLKAADAIGELPITERKLFQKEITACAKSDQNEVVKTTCSGIKF